MRLDYLGMDDISTAFPSYPPHNRDEFSEQLPEMPAYNVFNGPIPPHHPGAPPAAPMSSRNSTSHMPHASMAPLPPASRSRSSADTNRPVRKRITRACDQCNQLRTRCNGQQPCNHCTDLEIECQYDREQKKRGKASRREFPQRAVAKNSCNSTDKFGSADAAASKKKAKRSEAVGIRVAHQATPSPLDPPSFATAARLTPMEGIPAVSVLPNSRGESRYCCFEHMPANGMDGGNEFVPVYDGVQLNESGDVTGSETSFNTYAGQFNYHYGSGSEALAIGQKIPPQVDQPGSAQLQGVKKFGEEPVSMDNSNWQNAIPSSRGPHFLSSLPAATFGYTSPRYPNFEPTVPTTQSG